MIAFDIETAAGNLENNQKSWFAEKLRDKRLKDPDKIEESKKKAEQKFGLSAMTGKIILIGILSDTKITDDFAEVGDMYFLQLGLDGTTEKENLVAFWNIISNGLARGERLVSFNGKQFDMPFIFARSIIHQIPRPQALRTIDDFVSKYKNMLHVDVFNVFNNVGKQSEWANIIGISPDLASDGQFISEWFEAGDFERIKEKNKLDLVELASIFRLMEAWV